MRRQRLEKASASLLEPSYTLKQFHADCAACFPELLLYVSRPDDATGGGTSSGITADDEYKRTVGALFAIYWLVRLDLGGAPERGGAAQDVSTRGESRAEANGSGKARDTAADSAAAKSGNQFSTSSAVSAISAVSEVTADGSASMAGGGGAAGGIAGGVASNVVGEGRRGFCFGVDSETWSPPSIEQLAALALDTPSSTPRQTVPPGSAEAEAAKRRAEQLKRFKFMQTMDWGRLRALMINSGVVCLDVTTNSLCVVGGRMAAMLTLTAIHDIMKLPHLLPTVLPEHAPFFGHNAGDVIRDHDLALGYVMLHDPSALPSFVSLPPEQQRAVRFTQADLGFNHGWLVQA